MSIRFFSVVLFFLISAVLGPAVSYSKLYLFHIALVSLIFSYFYLYGPHLPVIKTATKSHVFFIVMFLWYLVTVIWAPNKIYAFQYLFYILCGMAIVYSMVYFVDDCARQRLIFKALGFVFILEIMFSLLEAFTTFRLPISPFSTYASSFGRSTHLDEYDPQIINVLLSMPTGFQWNPNNLAVTMTMILPYFLFHKNFLKSILGTISIFAIIITTSSRGALIGGIIAVCIWGIAFSWKRFLVIFLSLIIVCCVYVTGPYMLSHAFESEDKRVTAILGTYDALKLYLSDDPSITGSIGARKELIRNGLDALMNTGGWGVGGGCSKSVQEEMGTVDGMTSMHNFFVEVFVEAGIVFGILFIIWYISIMIHLYLISMRTTISEIKYYASATSVSLLSFSVASISCSSVIYLLPMWLMFGFACVTINNYYLKKF
ncbi:MAG: O-antigen ligase family protein [Deltaproteobacteria bacterium]|nr:O-antigen ligase family protein [Deltaproteobacteria bacterium]